MLISIKQKNSHYKKFFSEWVFATMYIIMNKDGPYS